MTILFCLDAPPIVLDFEALIASAAAAIATADPTAICADGTDGFATGAAATFFALTCASSRRGYNADASAAVDADDARAKTTPRACDLPAARRRKVVVVVAHVAFALQLVDAIIVHASRCADGYGRRRRGRDDDRDDDDDDDDARFWLIHSFDAFDGTRTP